MDHRTWVVREFGATGPSHWILRRRYSRKWRNDCDVTTRGADGSVIEQAECRRSCYPDRAFPSRLRGPPPGPAKQPNRGERIHAHISCSCTRVLPGVCRDALFRRRPVRREASRPIARPGRTTTSKSAGSSGFLRRISQLRASRWGSSGRRSTSSRTWESKRARSSRYASSRGPAPGTSSASSTRRSTTPPRAR